MPLPPLELLLLFINDPQLPPVVYLLLEALLPLLPQLYVILLPEHLIVCLVAVGENINEDGENHGSKFSRHKAQLIDVFLGSCLFLSGKCRLLSVASHGLGWRGDMGSCLFALLLSKTMP